MFFLFNLPERGSITGDSRIWEVKFKPLNILLYVLLHRTDHSSKLCVCVNQQAVHIGPVTAAGCSGAAEAAAAPPSEPQSGTRPIAAHRHQFHLYHLVSLKGSGHQSLTSALQSSGPMPPCSAPPHTPSTASLKGPEVQHQAVMTSDREAVAVQRKTFQGLLFIFKISSFCFHLDSFDG